ncbi:MAG: spheroidene monooxygenase [Saprospirales bacterium]|nr:MAG: spheroidene monooxygenase [Saprospirales bacterium]
MESPTIVKETVLYIFQFEENKYWAFKQMRLAFEPLTQLPGLVFFKLLGCGGGNGFSLWPDFGTYALLTVWKNNENRIAFEEKSALFQEYLKKTKNIRRLVLKPIHGHGTWDAKSPFEYSNSYDKTKPVAVITRASIRTKKLFEFWWKVPGVSKRVKGFKGAEFSIGIGELPIIEQATFSIWKNEEAMKSFAYEDEDHKKVIELTRKRNWYGEEMFARFQLISDNHLN